MPGPCKTKVNLTSSSSIKEAQGPLCAKFTSNEKELSATPAKVHILTSHSPLFPSPRQAPKTGSKR